MGDDGGDSARKRQNALFLTAAGLVACSVIVLAYQALHPYITGSAANLHEQYDWQCLNRGLDSVHELRDTAKWWTGTWCGVVPFWRPLTSYVFWAMRLLWPAEYMLPREIVHLVAHLVFVIAATVLLWRLTKRRWLVLTAVWLFAGYRPFPIGDFFPALDPVLDTMSDPKNIADPLAGTAMLLSLILVHSGRWKSALMWAAVSVGFKEIGFATWLLAPAMLTFRSWRIVGRRDRSARIGKAIARNRIPILTWMIALAVLTVVHLESVGVGAGFRISKYLHHMMALYFGGPVVRGFLMRDPGPSLVAALSFLSILLSARRKPLIRLAMLLTALALGVLLNARIASVTWDVSLAQLFSYRLDLRKVLSGVFWLVVVRMSAREWRWAAFGLVMALLASLPTWLSAIAREHVRYVSAFFMEAAVGGALCASALWLRTCGPQQPATPNTQRRNKPVAA